MTTPHKKPALITTIHVLLGIILFVIPLYVTKEFVITFIPEKTFLFFALVELTFFLWIVAAIRNRAYLPQKQPVLIALGAFLALFSLAAIFGVNFELSFWSTISRMTGLLFFLHVGAFVLVLATTVRDARTWRKLFASSVCAATIVAIVSYFGRGGFEVISLSSYGGSLLGNSSYTAIYLLGNVFLALFLAQSAAKKYRYLYYTAIAAILLSPMFIQLANLSQLGTNPLAIIGQARAAVIAGIIGILIYIALRSHKKVLQWAVGAVVVCVIATTTLLFFPHSLPQQAIKEESGSRFLFWQSATSGIADRPLLGWGPENYQYPFYTHFQPDLHTAAYGSGAESHNNKPHNMYLNIATSGGLLSLAAFLVLLYATFRTLIRAGTRANAPFIALLAAYGIYILFLFETIAGALILSIILGYAARSRRAYQPLKRFNVAWLALLLVLLPLWHFVFVPYEQQLRFKQSFSLPNDISMPELFALTSHARESVLRYMAARTYQILPTQIQNPNPQEQTGFFNHMLAMRAAMAPYISDNYRLKLQYTKITIGSYLITKDPQLLAEALEHERELFLLSPNNPEPYWIRAQRQEIAGNRDDAIATLEAAYKRWPQVQKTKERLDELKTQTGELPLLFL